MSITPVERVLSKVSGAMREGKGWTALCPGCDSPTLVIRENDDGSVQVYCTSECEGDEWLPRIGLTHADLRPPTNGRSRKNGKAKKSSGLRPPTPDKLANWSPINGGIVAGDDGPVVTPKLLKMQDVQPQPVRWLWPQRIPLGKLSMVVGDPSVGKSTLLADVAARVSTGKPWPDGTEGQAAGGVVLLSAEDDPADTIRPRLDAAGADVSRIAVLQAVVVRSDGAEHEQHFSLGRDLPVLEDAIGQVRDCRLVVVDPISAYLGETDSHKNAAVRGLLAPLSDLAARYGVAVVLVEHLNKRAGGPAMYRPGGSIAFTAAARAVWSVSRSEDDRDVRLMLPVKTNLARDVSGLSYTIVDSPEVPGAGVLAWSNKVVTMTADDALAGPDGGDGQSALQEAVDWLNGRLMAGPQPSGKIKADAKRDGIADRTLERARKRLGAVAAPDGFGGPWMWSLPQEPDPRQCSPSAPVFANVKTLANSDDVGELWTTTQAEWGEV